MRLQKLKTGFTLMEIMVVIIIIGILATIAIPNYSKTIDRSRLQDAMQQLITLHAANMILRAQSGTGFLDTFGGNWDHITFNPLLGINIIPNGFTYTYTGTPTTFTATAKLGTTYTVTITEIEIDTDPSNTIPDNPICTGGAACPGTGPQ